MVSLHLNNDMPPPRLDPAPPAEPPNRHNPPLKKQAKAENQYGFYVKEQFNRFSSTPIIMMERYRKL